MLVVHAAASMLLSNSLDDPDSELRYWRHARLFGGDRGHQAEAELAATLGLPTRAQLRRPVVLLPPPRRPRRRG